MDLLKKVDVGGTIMVKAFVKPQNLWHSVLPNPMSLLDLVSEETKGKHHPWGNEDDKGAEADQTLPMRRPMSVKSVQCFLEKLDSNLSLKRSYKATLAPQHSDVWPCW